MRTKILAMALSVLFVMPCVLHAEEIEIQLFEVIGMSPLPGDDPLDGSDTPPINPTRPNDFHATINGNSLLINKQNFDIPFAHATVVHAPTGNTVVNQQFTTCLNEQINLIGVFILHIQTAFGELIGQFIVQ